MSGNFPAVAQSWTSYTPSVNSDGGVPGSYTASIRYLLTGKTVQGYAVVDITTLAPASGIFYIGLPLAVSSGRSYPVYGRCNAVAGVALCGRVNGSTLLVTKYDNTGPGANNESLLIQFTYEID